MDGMFSEDTPCGYPPLVSYLRYVQAMTQRFAAERAISPTHGSASFVVIDGAFILHHEACEYIASLRFRDRSVNTERVYAGCLALFLSYCAENRLDWHSVTAAEPEINAAITHLGEVLVDEANEAFARAGESMTTAAMVTYALDQIDQARTISISGLSSVQLRVWFQDIVPIPHHC